jgi:hypothetical protein
MGNEEDAASLSHLEKSDGAEDLDRLANYAAAHAETVAEFLFSQQLVAKVDVTTSDASLNLPCDVFVWASNFDRLESGVIASHILDDWVVGPMTPS